MQTPLRHFGFLTLPSYSMIAFANAIEALRIANYVEGRECYRWTIYSLDGEPAMPSNGIAATPTLAFDMVGDLPDVLIVCGGIDVRQVVDDALSERLRRVVKQRPVVLGALCSGVYPLLAAGLMDGYRCAAHWEEVASLTVEFPRVTLCDDVFVIDRDRMTCASGAAPIDMMLNLIAGDLGHVCAVQASRYLVVDRVRAPREHQTSPVAARLALARPELIEAVELMEANVEEPLTYLDLARLVGMSERNMQRLFREQLDASPGGYYLTVRLKHARRLLLKSSDEIGEISLKCGFRSAGTFSKAYRREFGHPPSVERRAA